MTELTALPGETVYGKTVYGKTVYGKPERSGKLTRFGKGILSAAAVILVLFLALYKGGINARAALNPLASRTGFFFDTVITVSLCDTGDESLLDKCFEKMAYYEDRFSRTKEDSDVWKINHAKGKKVEVAEETADIITMALRYCELSGGAFDITIAPVADLWDFHQDAVPAVPDRKDLEAALSHVDYKTVVVEGNTVRLKDPEAGIDLGAIAKGYISDGIGGIIRDAGCKSALIDLGGNICALGSKPDGTPFSIGIRKPFGENAMDIVDVVPCSDGSVITSGSYERYFEVDGELYHHILDPETGYSARSGLVSVSIASPDAAQGDALSTVCFLLGEEKGMELIDSLDGVEALFIDESMRMTASSGWKGKAGR